MVHGGDEGKEFERVASTAWKWIRSMTKNIFSRRSFLRSTAGVAGATVFAGPTLLDAEPWRAAASLTGPNDRIRFGIVGVGMEGNNLLSNAIQLPGVEC